MNCMDCVHDTGAHVSRACLSCVESNNHITREQIKAMENAIPLAQSSAFQALRDHINCSIKPSRERSIALTKLDEAELWYERGLQEFAG